MAAETAQVVLIGFSEEVRHALLYGSMFLGIIAGLLAGGDL